MVFALANVPFQYFDIYIYLLYLCFYCVYGQLSEIENYYY